MRISSLPRYVVAIALVASAMTGCEVPSTAAEVVDESSSSASQAVGLVEGGVWMNVGWTMQNGPPARRTHTIDPALTDALICMPSNLVLDMTTLPMTPPRAAVSSTVTGCPGSYGNLTLRVCVAKGSGAQPGVSPLRECAADPLETPIADLKLTFSSAMGNPGLHYLFATTPGIELNVFYCPFEKSITAPPDAPRVSCQ
jgi:hypothetical protein